MFNKLRQVMSVVAQLAIHYGVEDEIDKRIEQSLGHMKAEGLLEE